MNHRGSGSSSSLRACVLRVLAVGVVLLGARQARATVITAMPVDFVAPEHSAFNGAVAVFTDDNPAATPADFTATIDWGDGSSPTAGTIASSSAAFAVLAGHTYADEGSFTVTVTISDVAPGTGIATATDTATITETDVLAGTPLVFSAPLGVSFTVPVANFTDADTSNVASDFTAVINWGDATTTAGTVAGGAGAFQVSGTHTYAAPGTYSVVVTLSDDAPGTATATATSTARVGSGTLAVASTPISAVEGTVFNGTVATFSDTDTTKTPASFTATVSWGDGSTSPGTITGGSGSFVLKGQHTWAEEGTFTVTSSVSENAPGTASGTATGTATVAESDSLTGTPTTFSAAASTPFTGPVASFSDTNTTTPASGFSATINWGDGSTSPGTVTGGGGAFTVSGTHTYAAVGTYSVTVTLTDVPPGTATATVTSTANVAAAAAAAAVPTLGFAGLLALGLALGLGALALLRSRP